MNRFLKRGQFTLSRISLSGRAKSNADFISKIEGGLQELDESLYWLDLLIEGDFVTENKLKRYATKPKN